MAYRGEPDFAHGSPEGIGVLMVNLGTPDAPTTAAVRRYLAEFLWDPRVIESPRPLWWLILHAVILRIRPARSAALYRKVWTEEGSPLLTFSRRQAAALEQALSNRLKGPLKVALAMRYGKPSMREGLEALQATGVRRLLVLPMYPQYSATTTASTFDAIADVLRTWRWLPELRFINHYHDDSGYIETLAASVREAWQGKAPAERLLMSFHGVPKRYLLAGDPYHCECQKTARLLAEALDLPPERWAISFQSRVGREEWLKPYTDHTLMAWGAAGLKSVDVVCPGFPADCLETLEEIAQQNREFFHQSGGGEYRYIPALNDRPDHIAALADLVLCHAQGWPEADPAWNAEQVQSEGEASRERAKAMGAAR